MNKRIGIVGGGPVGSTLSILLAQRGYQVDLFDKRADPLSVFQEEGRSFNLSVSVRAINAFKKSGVYDKVFHQITPMHVRTVHMPDGTLHSFPYGRSDECVYSIRRRHIQGCMSARLKTFENIRTFYNTQVKDVNIDETTLKAICPDQVHEKLKYDWIIGSDGAFSAVQKSYLQTIDFNYSIDFGEYGYLELNIPPTDDGKFRTRHDAFHFWPKKGIVLAGLPNTEKNFTIGAFIKLKGENSFEYFKDKDPLEFQKYIYKTFEDCEYLMPQIQDDFINNPIARVIVIKAFPWVKNQCTLIGDAAHAMTPFYGQGLNSGLEDAVILDELLQKHKENWVTATAEFQKVRKPNVDAISQLSGKLFDQMREITSMREYLLTTSLTSYLSDVYRDSFLTQQAMVYLTHTDFSKCLSYSEVQAHIMKSVLTQIPDIETLIALKQHDKRVEKILLRYQNIYSIDEVIDNKQL